MSSLPRCKGAVANCRVNEADVSRTRSGGYASERTEAAPIKCAGRESAGRPTDSHIESVGRPTDSLTESVGKPADSLPSHFIGAASVVQIEVRMAY